jgi:hypothetical protein
MQLRELAMINGTLRDDQDHFKEEMRQLVRDANCLFFLSVSRSFCVNTCA